MSEQQVQLFRNAIKPFLSDWRTIDLKVIAQKDKDKQQWLFNTVHVVLEPESPSQPSREDLPSIEDLLVIHERWDISHLDELLQSISRGELSVGTGVILIKRFDGQGWQPISWPSTRLIERSRCLQEFGIDFTSFLFEGLETISGAVWQGALDNTTDTRLRSGKPPWDGLADLRKHFIGFKRDMALRADLGIVRVIAPIGMRLAGTSVLENENIRAFIERKTGIAIEEASLAVIAQLSYGKILRNYYPIREVVDADSNDSSLAVTIPLHATPSRVVLIVSYRNVVVDRLELLGKSIKNTRFEVFRKIVGDVQAFPDSLKAAQGRQFENLIAILLHLLGFSSAHYGGTRWKAADILAFPESVNWLLVVECTSGEPDLGNKLTKLATRTKKISQSVEGLQAFPVLVTAIERSLLNQTDKEMAAKEEIAIVTSEEIPKLVTMALEGTSPSEVYYHLSQLVPPSGLFFTRWRTFLP